MVQRDFQRLENLWLTTSYRNVTTIAICSSYKMDKDMYGTEKYPATIVKVNRIYKNKFRTRNNEFYHDVRREERYCDICNYGQLGD